MGASYLRLREKSCFVFYVADHGGSREGADRVSLLLKLQLHYLNILAVKLFFLGVSVLGVQNLKNWNSELLCFIASGVISQKIGSGFRARIQFQFRVPWMISFKTWN